MSTFVLTQFLYLKPDNDVILSKAAWRILRFSTASWTTYARNSALSNPYMSEANTVICGCDVSKPREISKCLIKHDSQNGYKKTHFLNINLVEFFVGLVGQLFRCREWIGYWLQKRGITIWFPVRERGFSFLQSVQTVSCPHQALYPTSIVTYTPEKATDAWSSSLTAF